MDLQMTLGPTASLDTKQDIYLLAWKHASDAICPEHDDWLSLIARPDGGVCDPSRKAVQSFVSTRKIWIYNS